MFILLKAENVPFNHHSCNYQKILLAHKDNSSIKYHITKFFSSLLRKILSSVYAWQ